MPRLRPFVAFACVSVPLLAAGLMPSVGKTVSVLLPIGGEPPDDTSSDPALSDHGRVVAFASLASNLVANDGDGQRDIDLVDLKTGLGSCVSVSTAGVKSDGDCSQAVLDRRGRHVAFTSAATNLVADDTNGLDDVFVHDRKTGATVRASVASDGAEGDGDSGQPWLSHDGRHVAFASDANLVADDTNASADIYLHDLETGLTTRVSIGDDGAELDGDSFLPRLSGNGRFLAFRSAATNAVPFDDNGVRDVFVRDLKTGDVEMVSVGAFKVAETAAAAALSISANGRRVAFSTLAGNLTTNDAHVGLDVFVRDRSKDVTTLVSLAVPDQIPNGASDEPVISGNGKWVAFTSAASTLVPDDTNLATDVFRHRLATGVTERVSLSSSGLQGDADSDNPALSREGRFVVFSTRATTLIEEPTDGFGVIVLRRP